MKVQEVKMVMSAVSAAQYPQTKLPEIALSGRSNVGKSSLINQLIQRKSYARTSGQPGKTQTLNFYEVNQQLYFVDFPGYGYAKVSKKERERFGQIIEEYITSRSVLRGTILLIDGRHEPTADDLSMYHYLQYYQIPVLVVATKIDKIVRSKWTQQQQMLQTKLGFNQADHFCLFSAVTGQGTDEIWDWILQQTEVGAK